MTKVSNQEQNNNINVLLDAVFNAIYVTPSQEQKDVVNVIINGGKSDVWTKSIDICDYLEIERRGNKQVIEELLTIH